MDSFSNIIKHIKLDYVKPELQLEHNFEQEEAQVHHAPRETFPIDGNVRKVVYSMDSLVLCQVGLTRTKPIDTKTTISMESQRNPICEPKIAKR
ncbi:MAG: hypothetical protein EZS28_009347 [Streblomastix strix]|uniref:Uncharacterized protein n=1 Tax=Streblomastix strix TaxID=222440 RepID=A0A5J4WKI2_9EUKA|nr:MAG: hypothetical protein EZS28_009347 [Streblomastix strix]